MYYSIRHLTKFLYSNPVSESMMETRMHPRSDQNQRCLTFHLSVSPRCRVFSYRDHLANQVHHFDIPGQHGQLVIVAESLVEVQLVVLEDGIADSNALVADVRTRIVAGGGNQLSDYVLTLMTKRTA